VNGRAAGAAREDEVLDLVRLRLRAVLFSGHGVGWGAAPPVSYCGKAPSEALTPVQAVTPARDTGDMGAVLASGRTGTAGQNRAHSPGPDRPPRRGPGTVPGRPFRRHGRARAVARALCGWFTRRTLPGDPSRDVRW